MEKSTKRGKIPQSDWPSIMARYNAGETLASIAKTYDCSPPAISYVVSRSRVRQADSETAPKVPAAGEVQLVKAATGEAAASNGAQPLGWNGSSGNGALTAAPLPRVEPAAMEPVVPREANGFAP